MRVEIEPAGTQRAYRISVEDDSPDGFRDLSQAYTLFAESYKRDDFGKRGRFNFGEKMVIACCDPVRIVSTTGTVTFTGNDAAVSQAQKRQKGTALRGIHSGHAR